MIMATFLSENTKKVPKSRSLCRFSEIFNWKFLFHLILLREFLQFSFKSFALRNSRKFYGINFRTKEKRPRNITVLLKFTDILTNYFLDCIQQIFIGGSSCFVTQLVSHGSSVDNNNTGSHCMEGEHRFGTCIWWTTEYVKNVKHLITKQIPDHSGIRLVPTKNRGHVLLR